MNNSELSAELFILKGAAATAYLSNAAMQTGLWTEKSAVESATDALIESHIGQIEFRIRVAAERMAEFYQLFYMLENSMRQFVSEVLADACEDDWWVTMVPPDVQKYASDNKKRESREGLPPRSTSPVDYITFGHLGEIIKQNWDVFGGLFPNCEIERLEKVIARLNLARGPIAHSGYLPEDEVVRLKLAIRDWFSLSG